MKTISYTYEQITGIVNNLNRLQVTGLEQARALTMVGVLLDEGVQSDGTDGETSGGTDEPASGTDGQPVEPGLGKEGCSDEAG